MDKNILISDEINENYGIEEIDKLEFTDIDEAFEYIGEFGRKKQLITAFLSLFMFLLAWNELGYLFYGLESSWQCNNNKHNNLTQKNSLEHADNHTLIQRYDNSLNTCSFNGTIKELGTIDKTSTYYNARCKMKRHEWTYTKSKDFSLITEYDFVCDRGYLSSLVLYFSPCGRLFGLIPSALCDIYGRKPVLFASTFMIGIANITGYFATNYIVILITMIVTTSFQSGMLTSIVLISSEFVGPNKRAMLSMIIWATYAMSFCLMALVSYFMQRWREMRLVLTIPSFFLLLLWRFIPESPRFLHINGRTDEAIKNLIASSDRKDVTFSLKERDKREKKGSFRHLFTSWPLMKKNMIYGSIGFYMVIIYFGINLSTSYLSGNFYLDFTLVFFVEIPAAYAATIFCNRYGRKPTTVVSIFLCLIALIVITSLSGESETKSYGIVRSIFGVSAKFFITVAFNAVYLLAIENYPTSIRSQALCLMNVFYLLAAVCSPWMALGLHKVNPYLPFVVMSFICLCNGLTSLLTTETRGKPTLEVVAELKNINDANNDIKVEFKPLS